MWQVGQKYELLNCDKHKSLAKKLKKDIAMCRPDIVHQVQYSPIFVCMKVVFVDWLMGKNALLKVDVCYVHYLSWYMCYVFITVGI